jgi:hypothetical protein
MKSTLLREITPLTQSDCFTLFSRVKEQFDFPLHYHEEFELNFIQNAKNARRVIGDHIEDIDELELVLVGSNLQHAWFTHHCKSREIREITIQFHKDLFDEKFLRRNQLSFIRTMLEKSLRGILFSKETTQQLAPRIMELNQKQGFDSVLELMSILQCQYYTIYRSRGICVFYQMPHSTIPNNTLITAGALKKRWNT